MDGEVFHDFIYTSLLTKLKPFNGASHNSVLILDNCSVHHVDEVHQALSDCGVITHYLPPYTSDYNPIELAFSKEKHTVKSMEGEIQAINNLETIDLSAFATITHTDCQQWYCYSCHLILWHYWSFFNPLRLSALQIHKVWVHHLHRAG